MVLSKLESGTDVQRVKGVPLVFRKWPEKQVSAAVGDDSRQLCPHVQLQGCGQGVQSSNSTLHQHSGTSGLSKKCFRCFSKSHHLAEAADPRQGVSEGERSDSSHRGSKGGDDQGQEEVQGRV